MNIHMSSIGLGVNLWQIEEKWDCLLLTKIMVSFFKMKTAEVSNPEQRKHKTPTVD